MKVTFAQLQALRLVARTGSFSGAARELGVTQPAVSQQISALQRALGIVLSTTHDNRPHLTDAGRFVAERADIVGQQVELLLRETAAYIRAERGSLEIAATLTIGNYLLPEILTSFAVNRPHIRPRVLLANTRDVCMMVDRGEVELGMVEGRIEAHAYAIEPFARERMALVVSTNHRFAERQSVRREELSGEPFVSREAGSGTRQLGYDLLLAAGIAPNLVAELPSGEAIARAVEAGMGAAILSPRVVERSAALGLVRLLDIEGLSLERTFWIARSRERVLTPIAAAFADFVLQRKPQHER